MKKPKPRTRKKSDLSRERADTRRKPANNGKAQRPRRLRKRTMARLRAEGPAHLRLDFARIVERLVNGGPKKDKWVEGAWCERHWKPIEAITYSNMINGHALCPDCRRHRTSRRQRCEELYFNTKGQVIGHRLQSDTLDTTSIFECVRCGWIWSTSRNGLTDRAYSPATGCPDCASRAIHKREDEVDALLCAQGLRPLSASLDLTSALVKLRHIRGDAFVRHVSIPRNDGGRALELDFLLCIGGTVFGLEVDGPQHYGLRYRNFEEPQFAQVATRDAEKVARLAQKGLEIRRVPLPLLGHGHTLEQILAEILAGQSPYFGCPNPDWIPPKTK